MTINKRTEYTLTLSEAELKILMDACDLAWNRKKDYAEDPLRTTEEGTKANAQAQLFRSMRNTLQNARAS